MRTPLDNGTVFYSCRILSRILDTTIQNNSASILGVTKVRAGKISGGSSSDNSIYQLTVPTLDRRGIIIYEGCDYQPATNVYVCRWRANTAWDRKSSPTFADALALVRRRLWQFRLFQMSNGETDTVNVPRAFFNCWSDLLCYVA